MPAAGCQGTFAVAESRFDEQHRHVELIDTSPEKRVSFGVATEYPVRSSVAVANRKAAGRHAVNGGQNLDVLDGTASNSQTLAHADFMKRHQRSVDAGNHGKVWPDDIVENMRAQCLDGGAQRMDTQRRSPATANGVDHQWQGGNVIEVRMSKQHIVDTGHLIEGEITDASAGVDQQVVVEQERGGAASSGNSAGTPENTNLHFSFEWRLPGSSWSASGRPHGGEMSCPDL